MGRGKKGSKERETGMTLRYSLFTLLYTSLFQWPKCQDYLYLMMLYYNFGLIKQNFHTICMHVRYFWCWLSDFLLKDPVRNHMSQYRHQYLGSVVIWDWSNVTVYAYMLGAFGAGWRIFGTHIHTYTQKIHNKPYEKLPDISLTL